MTVQSELDRLFESWRTYFGQAGARFVRDGVMCSEHVWDALPIRIVFLLKEAHDREGVMAKCQYDLVKLFNNPADYDQNRKTVERRVKRWTRDFFQAAGAPLPTEDPRLLPFAVINLSKLPGTSKADDKVLRDAAVYQASFLQEQLRIVRPHWVVCGGTFKYINSAWGGFEKIGSSNLLFRGQNLKWIDHCHPSFPGAPARHKEVIDAVQRSLG